MAFCPNCGSPVNNDAKFCSNCSHPLKVSDDVSSRKTVQEGTLHKCPSCGEIIGSFTAKCPACGYEIRGSKSSSSVQKFVSDLSEAVSDDQKASIIRSFPIPNTKEDILEFMLLASTNLSGEQKKGVFDAWLVKFEQSYQKAKIVIKDESDFSRVEEIHEHAQKLIRKEKFRHGAQAISKSKGVLPLVGKNLPVIAGLILYIMAIVTYKKGGNGSMLELAGVVVLIASAATLARRNASVIEYVIGLISGLLSIAMSRLLDNGSMLELGGVVVLIVVAVNFFRGSIKKGNKEE